MGTPEGARRRRRPARVLHDWEVSVAQAKDIQNRLRHRIVARDDFGPVRHVAGTDVGFEAGNTVVRGAVAVLSFPGLDLCDQALARLPVRFPYVPGYLSFREIPVLLEAMAALRIWPDVVLCDGQGLAHPRRFGLACHFGLAAGVPAVGVAKSRLIGVHREPAVEKGAWEPLLDGDEPIGAVVRTRTGKRPLYVSVGHRVSLSAAIALVLACAPRYRLPETTRAAHRLASGG